MKAIALVHEQLYGTQSLNCIDTNQYFADLARNIIGAYRQPEDLIPFTIHAEGITLELNKAIFCGLIVTELASNCFKHAFSLDTTGHITIGVEHTQK